VAFRNLREEILELFEETAPVRLGWDDKLKKSMPLALKRARADAWAAANPLKMKQAYAKYRAAHPEVLRAWKKANPEKVRAARLREFAKRREKRALKALCSK
jgi:hypothetical protein